MAKSKLSKRGKQELKKHQQEEVRRYRNDSRKGKIANREGVLIYAPVQSFLPGEELWWISFVNRREWWDKEARPDFIEAIDHILRLLGEYLDALGKAPEERERKMHNIASEITEKMRIQEGGLSFSLAVNPGYSSESDNETQTGQLFLFSPPGDIAGYYISLARFLGGKYTRRLKRCRHCQGLFIAPDNHGFGYCPLTDHKDRYWQDERAKISYHRDYQAARRNPNSSR